MKLYGEQSVFFRVGFAVQEKSSQLLSLDGEQAASRLFERGGKPRHRRLLEHLAPIPFSPVDGLTRATPMRIGPAPIAPLDPNRSDLVRLAAWVGLA